MVSRCFGPPLDVHTHAQTPHTHNTLESALAASQPRSPCGSRRRAPPSTPPSPAPMLRPSLTAPIAHRAYRFMVELRNPLCTECESSDSPPGEWLRKSALFLELTPTSFIMSKYCVTIIKSSTWQHAGGARGKREVRGRGEGGQGEGE